MACGSGARAPFQLHTSMHGPQHQVPSAKCPSSKGSQKAAASHFPFSISQAATTTTEQAEKKAKGSDRHVLASPDIHSLSSPSQQSAPIPLAVPFSLFCCSIESSISLTIVACSFQ